MLLTRRFNLRGTIVTKSAALLSNSDKKKIIGVIIIQVTLGILDLIGVALLGILGALAISGAQSKPPGDRVKTFLDFFHLSSSSVQNQATIVGLLAAFFLVSKTVVSVYFVRKIIFFMARKNAEISARLLSKVLSQTLTNLRAHSMQETLFAVTSGVNSIIMGVLNTSVIVISDVSLLAILGIGLFVVDPFIAMGTLLVFSLVSYFLYSLLQIRARKLGEEYADLSIKYSEKLLEVLNSYREVLVRNRREFFASTIGNHGFELSNIRAEQAFMPNISKYILEITIVLGGLIIGAIQFLSQEAGHAVAVLTVFMAASTRIAPAVLRLQQGALTIKTQIGSANSALSLVEELKSIQTREYTSSPVDFKHIGFAGSVSLEKVTFSYSDSQTPAVRDLSFDIQPGKVLAIVGPSGAGKTSAVDLILGIIKPDQGKSLINGLPPMDAISKWPGAIAYVPQDVVISNSSIRANILLGYEDNSIFDDLIWESLRAAHLDDVVKSLPHGLDTVVGDRGAKLSGGQRQRLGIARALFTKPKLLILDEATSALDATTESHISESIQNLKGEVTLLIIAHRLSTVRNADALIYLDKGEVVAKGTFEQVRQKVPDFDLQARMMGLI